MNEDDFDGDSESLPLAYMQSSTPSSPLMLVLEYSTMHIRDDVIAAFLILEQRLRVLEKDIMTGNGFALAHTAFPSLVAVP